MKALLLAVMLANPILFVTQVPVPGDFTTVASTFGNHVPSVAEAPRGGDLWIRYPDGTVKNLTRTTGFGSQPATSSTPGKRGMPGNRMRCAAPPRPRMTTRFIRAPPEGW